MNKLLLLLISLTPMSLASQFMENGSFEGYNNNYCCEAIDRADYWYNIYNSCDLKHEQVTTSAGMTRTGEGCAGFGLVNNVNSEYFYGTTKPLTANVKYVLTFYVKNGNSTNTMQVGAKIVNTVPSPVYPYPIPPAMTATPSNAVQLFLNNPSNAPDITYIPIGTNYQKISYCFVPSTSGVHYVIFGNFSAQIPSNLSSNYFFIDDVEISEATTEQQNLNSSLVLTSTALCAGNSILFDGSGSLYETEYQWEVYQLNNNQPTLLYSGINQQGSVGTFDISYAFNAIAHVPQPGNCYRVKLIVFNGCKDETYLDFCFENTNIDFLYDGAPVCDGAPLDFSITGEDDWLYSWSTGVSGYGIDGYKTITVYPSISSPAVSVTVSTPSGCTFNDSYNFSVLSNNNIKPWMNGINGSGEYTIYVNSGEIIQFNSQMFNDNPNESFSGVISNNSILQGLNVITEPTSLNNHNLGFYWNTGFGPFLSDVDPGVYSFTITAQDNNDCSQLPANNFTFNIIVICPNCPICIDYENRGVSGTLPLPQETKTAKCIEAGLTQNVNTNTSQVLFQAGQYVDLGPFFQAGPGFSAMIDPMTCVTDCDNCCNDWAGFTYEEIPYQGALVTTLDTDPTNDIFQLTDYLHPYCAYGAFGFELDIYRGDLGSDPVYSLSSNSNECCSFISPSPDNPIPHASIWWNGIEDGYDLPRIQEGYVYTITLYGCNGESIFLQGFLMLNPVWYSGLNQNDSANNITEEIKGDDELKENFVKRYNILDNSISLSPNPAMNVIELIGLKISNHKPIQIFDVNGALVDEKVYISEKNQFDISHLSSGTYYCKFIVEGISISKKFIKI